MLKIIYISLILFEINILLKADKDCGFADCNHEGECRLNSNEKICQCIGNKYFKGPKCLEAIDVCEKDMPCKNGGKCIAVTGQFMCTECNSGFGGLWCDSTVSNVFTNLLIYFNHYGFYAKAHKFIIMAETLGEVAFSVEFVSDHYAVDSWETKPGTKEGIAKWSYSMNLTSVIQKENIRYHNDLPYHKGYYHVSSETFWDYGLLKLTLRSYDTETGSTLFFQNVFDLLVLKITPQCMPQLTFFHGANPVDPLMVDIARYNSFEAILKQRCSQKSKIIYKWSVYNSIGMTKLYDFGTTKHPLLKVPPYKLWFNYHGEVMSSYQIRIRMEESYGQQLAVTQSSCFILVLPKPVTAIIKGGKKRAIGAKQDFYMDGSASRDYALAPNVTQDMIYRWDCISVDDPDNRYCKGNIGSNNKLQLKLGALKINCNYKFTLIITSKVNKLVTDQTHQLVQVVEQPQLFVDIQCIRNCNRQQFTADNFIHLKAVPVKGKFSDAAKFSWISGENAINQEQRLIYTPKDMDITIKFEVVVEDDIMSGKAFIELTKNLPPYDGSCSIEPVRGEAFITEFHIKCQNYEDDDTPLNYQYWAGKFPLQRTNDPEINIKLPETNEILIKICDQFEACAANSLTVFVSAFREPKDFYKFLTQSESRLSKLLTEGDVLSAMILMKSLVKYIKSKEELFVLIQEIKSYNLLTLLDVEQFFSITKELIYNILPLDYQKSYVFIQYFKKLNKGFEALVKDQEISDLKKKSYENLSKELMEIMGEFSKSWETIPQLHLLKPPATQADNPLAEYYNDLPDFDILTLKRILNWLHTTKALQKCFHYMGLAAVELYYPLEGPLVIQHNDISLQVYALENIKQHDIKLKNDTVFISLSESMIKDLKQQLQSSTVLLQIASLNNNPFWWFPDDEPLDTDVLLLSAFSKNSSLLKSNIELKHPLEFQMKLNNPVKNPFSEQIQGVLKNKFHMPIYYMEMNANAILLITFIRTEKPLKIKIKFKRNPRSFEVKQTGRKVHPNKLNKRYIFTNHKNEKVLARLAILLDADDDAKNVTFSLKTEIRECLYWDFELADPQWSSRGCKAQIRINKSLPWGLKCECNHLSSFAAKTYEKSMQEDFGNRDLLQDIPLNWYMVTFYISLLTLIGMVLLYNFYIYKNHKEYLIHNSCNDNIDVEIRLYTGSHWNSGTTANITLKLISEKGLYSLTIYQNPENPQLKKSSVCKLRLSANDVQIPTKLVLVNDLAGRYPSWYCRKIEIENIKSQQKQLFQINQWISENSLEVTAKHSVQTFKEKFLENLSICYIDWYQFNALWGCWQYEDLNRFERSCVWLSQFMVSLCVVACYYGPTTMETYEKERELYNTLHFNILEILVLAIVCYLAMDIVKLIFILILKI